MNNKKSKKTEKKVQAAVPLPEKVENILRGQAEFLTQREEIKEIMECVNKSTNKCAYLINHLDNLNKETPGENSAPIKKTVKL